MFAKASRQSSPCFPDVDLLTQRAGYAIVDIYGDACKVSVTLTDRLGPEILTVSEIKGQGTSFASCAFTFEGS